MTEYAEQSLTAEHETIEQQIREEMSRPAPDDILIHTLKKQKLLIKEKLEGVN